MTRALSRFVALGDSFTEGLDDMRNDGTPRGWADRVADVLSGTEPSFQYANLAVRSLRMDAILATQVPSAVAMRPDLATIAGGGNDVLGMRVSVADVAAQLDEAVAALARSGATTVVFAGFDPRHQLPPGRLIAPRIRRYNTAIATIARRRGAILIDLWAMPELVDSRMWSIDRLHLSALGHRHIAGVVLDRLDRPAPPGWPVRLDATTPRTRLDAGISSLTWAHRDLRPWLVRKIRGRTMGDGMTAKRLALKAWSTEQPATPGRQLLDADHC